MRVSSKDQLDAEVPVWYRDIIAEVVEQPQEKERQVRVPIGFPVNQYEWLRETAFRTRTTMAEVVRLALAEYKDRIDPQLSLPISGP